VVREKGTRRRGGRERGEKKANNQATALLNTVELDVGWQALKRNLEIDYKRDIWLI
jgi:hypothetical protein